MWTFIFLSVLLGLNSQTTRGDDSTQMYYFKLKIEKEAIENLTHVLTDFSTHEPRVEELEKTTTCQSKSGDSIACSCESDYRWSDQVCASEERCCKSHNCTFPMNSAHMCVAKTLVIISGTLRLEGQEYVDCVKEKNTKEFKQCNEGLLKEVKSTYSTLRTFDTIKILNYRSGSTIADLEMTIAKDCSLQDLLEVSKNFTDEREGKASLHLKTKGIVNIVSPTFLVPYESNQEIRCIATHDMDVGPEWTLTREDEVFEITDGSVSKVTVAEPRETRVSLTRVTEQWAGNYTCAYNKRSELYSISHQASAAMHICLKPEIHISMRPGFPDCRKRNSVPITVFCEIPKSSEKYNVTWTRHNIQGIIEKGPSFSEETVIYEASTTVDCNMEQTPQLICNFMNRCGGKRHAEMQVHFIRANDSFCAAEGDWENTKAGFTAEIKCRNSYGIRRRECKPGSPEPFWKPEYSGCVHLIVNSLLDKSITVDSGLGFLNNNTAKVFALLQNVTNNTQTINTFANLNVSVYVLLTMSQKNISEANHTTTNDFLESSSQMLNRSLNNSWLTDNDNDNISLAERYLSSVEHIIKEASIKDNSKKDFLEVDIHNCTLGSCTHEVFNVTIVLRGSDHGFVKSAGFKELQGYLPHNTTLKPNSIVVSTTTERTIPVQVEIKFPLLEQRRRNVVMQCVWWDNSTGSWSAEGCKWKVENRNFHEGTCTCEHLSSFAILVSKEPLKIRGLNEITYVGLSISVLSLIISLVIELVVWKDVVKTDTLYLRHTAHVNISLCLLVADCCFLASSQPEDISHIWCVTSVLLKHFCYLSMFFWMFCLSAVLLHQAVFLFHNVGKKNFLRLSLVLGYGCPFLIVVITFLTNGGGAEDSYFSSETCWLVYTGLLEGSIHTFIIPIGIIVFFNVFSMFVVLMRLLDHPKSMEKTHEKEKSAAMTILRSVILLTPIFGVTWVFGFAVMLVELTIGPIAYIVNYTFVLLNAFQGLFILLTTCLGDKPTREALLKYLKSKAPASTTDSTTKLTPILK